MAQRIGPVDNREFLISRLALVIGQLRAGLVFTLPVGRKHKEIVTDLRDAEGKPRVYRKLRADAKLDRYSTPCVEIITSPGTPDTITVSDDDLYKREFSLEIWGYVHGSGQSEDGNAGDDGTSPDSSVATPLNSLLADLSIAVEAFPYWANADNEAAVKRLGSIGVIPGKQWTEPATDQDVGFLVLEYAINYSYNRYFP